MSVKNGFRRFGEQVLKTIIFPSIIGCFGGIILLFLIGKTIEFQESPYTVSMHQTVEAQETLDAIPSSTPTKFIFPSRTPGHTEEAAEPPEYTETPSEPQTPTVEPTITNTPPEETVTSTPEIVLTPNATGTIQAAFGAIDQQFKNTLQSSIAFNKPKEMDRGDTTVIELLLNPAASIEAIATELVEHGDLATSTADPNMLISPSGDVTSVETAVIDITPRMKAVLISHDPDAFTVIALHDDAEQVIVSTESTIWRWSVTAKKEGSQTLELVLYQLIKYDGKEFWHEVETYKADIVVEVIVSDWIKSLDWKWFAGFIITLIGAVLGIVKWLDERKKKPEMMETKIMEDKKKTKELFDELEKHYLDIIAQMENEFTSHEFIEKLSQAHQGLYVQLLGEYEKKGQPFQAVHSVIAKRLKSNWTNFVVHIATEPKSENIFGNYSSAAVWRKVK